MTLDHFPTSHYMHPGKRVSSAHDPALFGTVVQDLGDRSVVVDWDEAGYPSTVCTTDDLEPGDDLPTYKADDAAFDFHYLTVFIALDAATRPNALAAALMRDALPTPDEARASRIVKRTRYALIPLAVGSRVYVPQLGVFGSVTELTPGHDCQRVRVALDAGDWFDTSDVALGIRR